MKTCIKTILMASVVMALSTPSFAKPKQQPQDDEVVVTGTRITQGGSQDINFFRDEIDIGRIPHAKTFTSEGLLSQHDLYLKPQKPCAQTLCLVDASMKADFTGDIQADYFLGLGFDSNIDDKTWKRAPLSLVAVVDKSGSMGGEPLERVKESLKAITGNLQPGDQLSIILYGADVNVHMRPLIVTRSNKPILISKINQIRSSGSTYMEAGLTLGYETARNTAKTFDGTTRVMLFTDERPNVGNTEATGFMEMARAASRQNIGLTTIGVGVQFGSELAAKIGSVRGGNLFFVRHNEDVKNLFAKEFDFMVSEVAHDLTVSITPKPGLKITGIYGVPQNMFSWKDDRSVEMLVPTAFLSSAGGGLFMTMARENPDLPLKQLATGEEFASVNLTYLDTSDQKQYRQNLTAKITEVTPSPSLRKAHLLVEEYSALRAATNAFHIDNNQERAYQTMRAFSQKLASSKLDGLEDERKLVAGLETQLALLSGHSAEVKDAPPYAKLWNRWKITRVEGGIDLRRGDVMEFFPDQQMQIFRKSVSMIDPDEEEQYSVNNKQIFMQDSELAFYYRVSKHGRLVLRHVSDDLTLYLRPVHKQAAQAKPHKALP